MLDLIPLGYKVKHRIKYGTDIVYSIEEGDKTNSANNMATTQEQLKKTQEALDKVKVAGGSYDKNWLELNAKVLTAKVTQSGNEELGLKEKNLYYLVIQTEKGKMQINVGEKTHDEVKKLTEK